MRYLIKTNLINKLAMYMFTAFVTCVTCMFYCTDCGTGNAFADRMVYAFGGVPYGYDPFKEGIPLEYNAYILQMVLLLTLGGLTDANIKADLIRRFGIKGFVIKRGIVLAIQIIIWGLINIIVVGLMSGNQGILEKNLIILYIASYLFKEIPLIIILFQLVFILDMIVKSSISIIIYVAGLLLIMIIPDKVYIIDNLFFKRAGVINGVEDFLITTAIYFSFIFLLYAIQIRIKTKQDFY